MRDPIEGYITHPPASGRASQLRRHASPRLTCPHCTVTQAHLSGEALHAEWLACLQRAFAEEHAHEALHQIRAVRVALPLLSVLSRCKPETQGTSFPSA